MIDYQTMEVVNLNEKGELLKKAYRSVSEDAVKIKSLLENEFRKILGVEN